MLKYNDNLIKNVLLFFRFSFMEYINENIKKTTIGVNFMQKLNPLLPRSSLLTVFVFSDLIWTMEMLFTINRICFT